MIRDELSLPRLTNEALELKPVTVSLGISKGPRSILVVSFEPEVEPTVTEEARGGIAEDEEAPRVENVLLSSDWDARDVVRLPESTSGPVEKGRLEEVCVWLWPVSLRTPESLEDVEESVAEDEL